MQVKQRRLLFPWLTLVLIAYVLPFLCDHWPRYEDLIGHDWNRWIHFIVFVALGAIPISAVSQKRSVLVSLLTTVPAVLLEPFHRAGSSIASCAQSMPADLFGIASGILLGLNLRAMGAAGRAASDRSAIEHEDVTGYRQ